MWWNPCLRPAMEPFLGSTGQPWLRADAVYPVLTTQADCRRAAYADNTDVAETDGVFSSDLLGPQRVQASFVYKRTDAMRFGAMDASLRMALNAGPGGKTRLRGDHGRVRSIEGRELGCSRGGGGDGFCRLHQQVLLRPRGWSIRGDAKRSAGR